MFHRGQLFLSQLVVHLAVRDALVAIDTGIALLHAENVLLAGAFFLIFRFHRGEVMAVTALARVGFLHRVPHIFCQLQALGVEFFRGIDRTQGFMQQLITGLHLAHYLVHPGIGDMAVGTGCAHAAGVGEVDGFGVFLIYVFFHFVAGDTKLEGVSGFHRGIETAPEDDPDQHEDERDPERCSQQQLAWYQSEYSR